MNDAVKKSEISVLGAVRGALACRALPFFTAAVLLVCNYLALDLVMFYYMVAVIAAMLVLLHDLTPLVGQFLFLNVIMSEANSPSNLLGKSDFLTQPAVYIQLIVMAAFLAAAIVYRFVATARRGSLRPKGIFWGLCALSAAFLLNGAGAAGYTVLNFGYGFVMAFAFLGIFILIGGNVRRSEENFRAIGWAFVAFSALLLIELSVKYSQIWEDVKNLWDDGSLYTRIKGKIVFGWGNWNTMGMLLAVSVSPVFLVASKYRHGWLLHLYAAVIALGAVLTCSRQAMVAVPFYVFSAVVAMVKGKRKLLHLGAFCAVALIVSTVLIARREWVVELYHKVIESLFNVDGDFTGNARMQLLNASLDFFAANPFFGSGFFVDFKSNGAADFANVSLVPLMAHNTLGEMIAVSGMFGILFYCVHRIQMIVAFAKKPSANKLYFMLAIGSLLLMSLVDNHLFYILPTVLYTSLLVFACEE